MSSSKLASLKEAIDVLNLKSNVSRLTSSNDRINSSYLNALFCYMIALTIYNSHLLKIVSQLLQYLRSFVFNCERHEQDHCNSSNSWTVVMMVNNLVRSQSIWAFHKISNNLRSDSLLISSQTSQWHTEQSSELRMQQLHH